MTAPQAEPRVFVDANVLYASAPRDIMMELALDGVIQLRWSTAVLDELSRALIRTRSDYTTAKALRLITAMMTALPEALLLPPEPIGPTGTLPDPDDAHVIAAACEASCTHVLTFNLKHFPADLLAKQTSPLTATHPDVFLVHLLTTRAPATLPVIERVRQRLTKPPLSVAAYADNLADSDLPQLADLLRFLLPA